MYVIRDIFQLKFGHYRDTRSLFQEAMSMGMFPKDPNFRLLTDFTGDSYRLIMEMSAKSLAEYEKSLSEELGKSEWRSWYDKFIPHVESSHREILKELAL